MRFASAFVRFRQWPPGWPLYLAPAQATKLAWLASLPGCATFLPFNPVPMLAPLPPPDHETLAGLRRRDNAAYTVLYSFYYPAVERLVVRNSGMPAEAQDLFQETVLVLLSQVATADFTLTSSLKTYLLAISSNLWLKHLRQARRVGRPELAELAQHLPAEESAAFRHEAETTLYQWVRGLLARLSEVPGPGAGPVLGRKNHSGRHAGARLHLGAQRPQPEIQVPGAGPPRPPGQALAGRYCCQTRRAA